MKYRLSIEFDRKDGMSSEEAEKIVSTTGGVLHLLEWVSPAEQVDEFIMNKMLDFGPGPYSTVQQIELDSWTKVLEKVRREMK